MFISGVNKENCLAKVTVHNGLFIKNWTSDTRVHIGVLRRALDARLVV